LGKAFGFTFATNPIDARLVSDGAEYEFIGFPQRIFPQGLKPSDFEAADVRAEARTLQPEACTLQPKPDPSGQRGSL